MPRRKAFATSLLLALLVVACSPRPPTWPPSQEEPTEPHAWYVDAEGLQESAHSGLACAECHADLGPGGAGHTQADPNNVTLTATKPYDYDACKSCHAGAVEAATMGAHAGATVQTAENEMEAITCGHCHDAHYARVETRAEKLASVSETCGSQCHPAALASYGDNFHGKAALAGFEGTATCTDCHGAHNVSALSATKEAQTACSRCHPNASEGFAKIPIHAPETLDADSDEARASYSRRTAGVPISIALCLDCHGRVVVEEWAQDGRTAVYVDPELYQHTTHSEISCIACHTDVARNPHKASEPVPCAECHHTLLTHVNMGAAHMSTDCAACHMEDLTVVHDKESGRVVLATTSAGGEPLDRTDHTTTTEAGCDKCHVPGNQVGAPATTLPARSVICMLCHDASPTVSVALFDATTVRTDVASILGLLIFAVGMVFNFSLYLGGRLPGYPKATGGQKIKNLVLGALRFVLSRRIFGFLGAAIAEGIFLRRTWRQGVGRWVIHALIYLPLLARLGLGLVTWLGMVFWPAADWVQIMADKNAPGVAFFYDLMTALMLLGVLLAVVRRLVLRDQRLLTFAQDRIALGLLGAIILVGILTEGIRLLSTGTPTDLAVYSFLGYGSAAVLQPLNLTWTSVYPVIWYAHAFLAAAFVAYFPFSKFMHILAAPLIASLDAARKGKL